MAKSQRFGRSGPAPDLLTHLEQAFDWSEGQALDALGAYLLSTDAGRALSRQLSPANAPLEAA